MKYNSIAFADIETTQIPADGDIFKIDTIHCIGVKSGDSPTLMYTSRFLPLDNYGGTLRNALDIINSHDYVVFHNFTFDVPVIEHLLGPITAKVLDTMLIAKLIYTQDELIEHDISEGLPPALYGSFSLDAFGRRMGEYKGSHSDWSKLTTAMCQYCTQDVEVTYHLFQTLLESPRFPSESVFDLEHEVAYLIAQQQYYGFYYDTEKARTLMTSLMYEQTSIAIRLQKQFKPLFLPKGPVVTPAKPRRTKQFVPDLNYKGF